VRIALIRKKYSPHGGAERYLSRLIDGLLKTGHEVHLFAHEWEKQTGVSFHRVRLLKGLSFLQSISFAYYARRAVKQEQFDLVHSLERTSCQDLYRAGDGCHREWLKQRRRIYPCWKNLLTYINPLHISLLYLEKRLYRYPDTRLIIANSQRGKQEIMRHYGYPDRKIEVIYNGVDTQRFHPGLRREYRQSLRKELGIAEDELVLLWVGSGFKRKGLDFLLQALDLLWQEGQRDWRLLVVGKGKIKPYRKKLQGKGYKERVVFSGPQAEVRPFYGAGDVFLLPTIYEPFANVCLEALACGLPVITSAMNGAAEILTPETGSVLSDPADIRQLAGQIKRWQDVSLRREAIPASRELAEQHTCRRNVQQTLEVYRRLLEEG